MSYIVNAAVYSQSPRAPPSRTRMEPTAPPAQALAPPGEHEISQLIGDACHLLQAPRTPMTSQHGHHQPPQVPPQPGSSEHHHASTGGSPIPPSQPRPHDDRHRRSRSPRRVHHWHDGSHALPPRGPILRPRLQDIPFDQQGRPVFEYPRKRDSLAKIGEFLTWLECFNHIPGPQSERQVTTQQLDSLFHDLHLLSPRKRQDVMRNTARPDTKKPFAYARSAVLGHLRSDTSSMGVPRVGGRPALHERRRPRPNSAGPPPCRPCHVWPEVQRLGTYHRPP